MKILITGAAGFIGYHLCKSLLENGNDIFGIDNLNSYYDPQLKTARLNHLQQFSNFEFSKLDIADKEKLESIVSKFQPERIVNLAAQAGVRYSIENPYVYLDSNITGFLNILECCRKFEIKGLIYASSSSVYGGNETYPSHPEDKTEKPLALYGATKKSNELMAYAYSNLYGIPTTGLRYFTVYGPWGRPDMALYKFAELILSGDPIPVYNQGKMKRDFTYIDDIIKGTVAAIERNFENEIFNLGNNKSENLMDMISILETSIDTKANVNLMPLQPGDVLESYADIEKSEKLLGYVPKTCIEEGIPKFVAWLKQYKSENGK